MDADFAGAAQRVAVNFLALLHGLVEGQVEIAQHLGPVFAAVGNLVELILNLCRELKINDVGKMLDQKVVYHHCRVGWEKLGFFGPVVLVLLLVGNAGCGEREQVKAPHFSIAVIFFDVAALLHRADGGGVGAGAADAHFLQLFHQRSLGVAGRGRRKPLRSREAQERQILPHRQGRQAPREAALGRVFVAVLFFLVLAFGIYFQKTLKRNDFATSRKRNARLGADADEGCGALHRGLGHLRGHGPLANKVVEALLGGIGPGFEQRKIGGPDGLVGLLGAGRLGFEGALVMVLGPVGRRDGRLRPRLGLPRQVHRVGSHVADAAGFVEFLGHLHRLGYREAQLAAGFLLQGTGGEGRGRAALARLFIQALNLIRGPEATLQKGFGFGQYLITGRQFGFEHGAAAGIEAGYHAVGAAAGVLGHFALTVHHEAHGHALHAAGAEAGFHFFPQHGAELEAHETVEHPAGLLGVYQVLVHAARVFDGFEDGAFGDFAEYDAPGFGLAQVQGFGQVPRNGLALAVVVTGQPHDFGFFGQFF